MASHTFTRQELYDFVWSEPMIKLAARYKISGNGLAKACRRADIPVPARGYKLIVERSTHVQDVQIAHGTEKLSIRLDERIRQVRRELPDKEKGERSFLSSGRRWTQEKVPTGELCLKIAEPARRGIAKEWRDEPEAPIETKLKDVLAQLAGVFEELRLRRQREAEERERQWKIAEERRQEYSKYRSSYFAPKYDTGIERRRLLIINTLFVAASRLGSRPSMSTSKYGQDAGSERDICISVGESHIHFTVEPIKSKKEEKRERLRLAFGMARDRANASKSWEDSDEGSLDDRLTDVLVEMLVGAEASYRNSLLGHREWIIERKAAAEAELKRRKEEAEREARELQEKLARERISRLLAQAKALDRANQIRSYVESVRERAAETSIARADFDQWAMWACQEADRIDPVKNGTIVQAIRERTGAADLIDGSSSVADGRDDDIIM